MVKIVTVRNGSPCPTDNGRPISIDMSNGRLFKISEALSRLGFQVDMAVADQFFDNNGTNNHSILPFGVRMVPLSAVKWHEYDVVKTVYHRGFQTLEEYGGCDHPFIISHLGSVVGNVNMEGIYFYDEIRQKLYETQIRINKTCRYIAVLNQSAGNLWQDCFGAQDKLLIVPGAADTQIPTPTVDPYPDKGVKRCLFAGNVYDGTSQPEANSTLINKLNRLGELLAGENIRVYLLGRGDIRNLKQRYVTYLGYVDMDACWNYMHHADIGIVVSAGKFMHNNESTKIYHYLRAGLPVVSESGFPNDHVVMESKLGAVAESEDMEKMAQKIIEVALVKNLNREFAKDYILQNHTWDLRVKVYDQLIKAHFNKPDIYLSTLKFTLEYARHGNE